MAKHDQRILKFLNQNADRAPTITEMMTRLNISISDISDSLSSLQSQALITKKTNGQGIECWYPTGPQASPQMVQPVQVPAQHLPTHQMPTTAIPIMGEGRNPQERPSTESRFAGVGSDRFAPAPEPQPPKPVPVQHIPMAEPSYANPSLDGIAPQSEPSMNGSTPLYGLAQPAPKGGVGFLTFALGLVLAVAMATWLGGRLAGNQVTKAAANFVDKKALTEATAELKEFQEKTTIQLAAMQAEVKKLTGELALSRSTAESLKTVAAVRPKEEAKAKPGKKAALAKAKAPTAASIAMAKAAARGAKKRKATAAAVKSTSRDVSESAAGSESSAAESSPTVPEPPGLEELPPPPSE